MPIDPRAARPRRPSGGPVRGTEARAVLLAALATCFAVWAAGGPTGEAAGVLASSPTRTQQAAHAFLHVDGGTGAPVRFDPCTPIAYVVNPEGAPEDGISELEEALLRTEAASGFTFRFDGFTDEVPAADRPPVLEDRYGPGWAPVLFGWVDRNAPAPPHEGTVVGWAYPIVVVQGSGPPVAVSGVVASLRNIPTVRPGFGLGRRRGNVLLHEIGHLLGLDHVDDPEQVMHADANVGQGTWGDGDLEGLRQLGRAGGCVRVPRP